MQQKEMLIIVIVALAAIALVVFLIRKNQKDKDQLNPDTSDAVDEIRDDQNRSSDKL